MRHRLDDDLDSGLGRLRGDLVGVVNGDVRAPGQRLAGILQRPMPATRLPRRVKIS